MKGAYKEPPSIAFPDKRDVDARISSSRDGSLGADARRAGVRAVFGTHDPATPRDHPRATPPSRACRKADCEFHLLYGIQRAEQRAAGRAPATASPC